MSVYQNTISVHQNNKDSVFTFSFTFFEQKLYEENAMLTKSNNTEEKTDPRSDSDVDFELLILVGKRYLEVMSSMDTKNDPSQPIPYDETEMLRTIWSRIETQKNNKNSDS